ncbi:MAG TPA: M48 family metalloprotease [Myxococcaceae bacterium]|nr:M48 family metalloprotease [Myxococcaceae bacterium]
MRRLRVAVLAAGAAALSCVPVPESLGAALDGAAHDLVAGGKDLAAEGGALAAQAQECHRLSTFDVPLKEETAVGGAVAVKWVSQGGGLVMGSNEPAAPARGPKDQMTVYVNTVGRNLAMQSSRPMIDWTFGVLESDDFNAVSAPGGYVLVTRGLLRRVDNEAQLAGVLAHEIAHVTEKHAIATYRKVKTDACFSAFGGKIIGDVTTHLRAAFTDVLKNTTGQMVNLDDKANFDILFAFTGALTQALDEHGFETDQEYDADRIGLGLVISAGYNPHEYVKFLAKIPEGGTAFPHHPSNADRQQRLAAFIQTYQQQPDFYPDYPFEKAPVVPLRGELAAAGAGK